MAEVTNELLSEVMKAVQAGLAQADGKVDEMKQELHASRTCSIGIQQELIGIRQEVASVHATLVRHEHRLDGIEQWKSPRRAPE